MTTKTYTLVTYDLWGNEEDGYQVNDKYAGETIELEDDASDEDILKTINVSLDCDVDWQGLEACYISSSSGKPLCELLLKEE